MKILQKIAESIDFAIKTSYTILVHRGVEQLAARWAHNPAVREITRNSQTLVIATTVRISK